MTKAELDKKHLAELHALAADAGVERYRLLSRAELVAKLADDDDGAAEARPARERSGESGERSEGERSGGERPRRRRSRGGRGRRPAGERDGEGGRESGRESRDENGGSGREPRRQRREAEPAAERDPEPTAPKAEPEPTSTPGPAAPAAAEPARPRRRRRRRFGRRDKSELTLSGLLLPPAGRQVLLSADSREGCTALLRGLAADLADGAKGPDPVALLVDPSPEELADWRRDAPQAEIVAAGQPRHASDALAQAQNRANSGDEVILLVDSLTRLAEAYGDADAAKEFFDAAGGNLTVVAALERPSS